MKRKKHQPINPMWIEIEFVFFVFLFFFLLSLSLFDWYFVVVICRCWLIWSVCESMSILVSFCVFLSRSLSLSFYVSSSYLATYHSKWADCFLILEIQADEYNIKKMSHMQFTCVCVCVSVWACVCDWIWDFSFLLLALFFSQYCYCLRDVK